MSATTELHELVERLDDEQPADALSYLHRLLDEYGPRGRSAEAALARRTGPPMMSGREFMAQRPRTWQELAAEQGVRPVEKIEDLFGDFWPEDESIDEFIAAVREWRQQGGRA